VEHHGARQRAGGRIASDSDQPAQGRTAARRRALALHGSVSGDDYMSLYSRYFPEGTNFTTAKALITQKELPADAQLVE
jgi:hypothetical protein